MTPLNRVHSFFIFASTLCTALLSSVLAVTEPAGLVPYDSRWDFPNYVTWRPANEESAILNPPRFSWPVSPVIPSTEKKKQGGRWVVPASEYLFQLSQDPTFPAGEKTIEKKTSINFENALPILANGTWYWRVGYAKPGSAPGQWGVIRSFTVIPGIPAIDRSAIDHAAADLAKLPRPRLAPPGGDWAALRRRLEADPFTAPMVAKLIAAADRALERDWWTRFPANDTGDGARDTSVRAALGVELRDVGRDLATVALAHRLTGDDRYRPVYDHALRAACFPPGGETSPEYVGSTKKWGTQWIPHLAYVYDLGWHDYTPEQRARFREGLRWRIDAVFNQAASWRVADGSVLLTGIAAFAQSHPYENAQLAAQGVLLMAGELPLADELTPVVLNYLLGVGSGHGPDGAWNEAGAYVFFKSKMMLDAALVADTLLPGLRIGESPYFGGIGDFVIQLAPPGMRRQGFGEYTADMSSEARRNNLAYLLQRVAALTGSPAARASLDGMAGAGIDITAYDSFVPLITNYGAKTARPAPALASENATAPAVRFFEEPGWFFVGSRSPSDWVSAGNAVRLATIARPRGGYSHSYSHDGAFVWQAFGTTLSAGGGIATYGDAYSRNTFSHNGVLIDGRGASFRNPFSENPVSARPLYWSHDAARGVTRWAADMTGGFLVSTDREVKKSNAPYLRGIAADRGVAGLRRWIRHYAFIDGRDAIIVDDLAMRTDAAPARFTWLHHVPGVVPVEHDDPAGLRARYTIDGVEATVRQYASAPVEVKHLRGFDSLVNPVTGTDYGPSVRKAFARYGRPLSPEDISGEVVTATTAPSREARFVTVLTARPGHEETLDAGVVITPEAVEITRAGRTTRVTLDADPAATGPDIPVTAVRRHAEASDPWRLPSEGTVETLALRSAASTTVEWLRRDTFSDGAWVNRWWVETEGALVRAVPGQGLEIRNDPRAPTKTTGTTVWLRADMPERLAVRILATNGSSPENNACNLNLILRARQSEDSPLVFGTRTGDYPELHKQPNYIVTFTGGYKPGWSRIRRDPGFAQVAQSGVRSEPGRTYELIYLLADGRLRTWIDGKPVHDWTDPAPLPNGKLGLRTWHSDIRIHSVEIGKLLP